MVTRLLPEMVPPNEHPMAVPPVIRPIYAAKINNRSVIRRAVRKVAVRITTVAIRVVSWISVPRKSDADPDRNSSARLRRREQDEDNRKQRDDYELFHSSTSFSMI